MKNKVESDRWAGSFFGPEKRVYKSVRACTFLQRYKQGFHARQKRFVCRVVKDCEFAWDFHTLDTVLSNELKVSKYL